MSVLTRTVNLLPRPRDRAAGFALCAEDNFWFRPAYTDGRCPLCGKTAPGGTPPKPLVARLDRSVLLMATLGLLSAGMAALVLVMYFQAS